MLPSSNDFKAKVYAQERQFKSRVAITMEAYNEQPSMDSQIFMDFQGKVLDSVKENPHLMGYLSADRTIKPTEVWDRTGSQISYDRLTSDDGTAFFAQTGTVGAYPQMLFSFNVVEALQREFGEGLWVGRSLLADKVALAQEIIKSGIFRWKGRGDNPKPNFFMPFRFIRDTINGSNANTTNYWNQINVMAGGVNLTTGKSVFTNGSLTNGVNITDGNASTYGYAWGGSGPVWVYIDLGSVRSDVDSIQVIHYYLDGRTFYDSKIEISQDGQTWYTIRDAATQGAYAETINGVTVLPKDLSTPKASITVWNSTEGQYEETVYHTSDSYELLELSKDNIQVDWQGFIHLVAYAQPKADATSAKVTLYTDYVEVQLNVALTDMRFYDDNTVISFTLLEEMSILNETLPANELILTMDNANGDFDLLNFKNMFQIISTKPRIDLELGLVLDDGSIEWKAMGVFFLTEWRTDVTSKIITLTCNDYFALLAETSFNASVHTNLFSMAQTVLTLADIPFEDQLIDDSLRDITVNTFPERIDSRSALQHIGIAAMCAVYQDRYGRIVIRPFSIMDEMTNYITYPVTQPNIFGYPSSNTYIVNNTEGGMRHIGFEEMYDAPEISLEKSVYELVITIYPDGADSETVEPIEKVYTNPVLLSNNGVSFDLNNPLIKTEEHADSIAEWYFRESNYNAHYIATWRQNPILECSDLILVEDSFRADKQTRIVKQVYDYQGFLSGNTESRGGV